MAGKSLRLLSEATFEGIIIHEGGVVISANNQFYEMSGYEPGDLLGKQALPLLVTPQARDYVTEQIASGSPGPLETIVLKKDGTTFSAEVRAREVEQEGRKIRVSVVRDITMRKQIEADLQENQEQFRRMFDQSPIGVAMVGLDFRFLRVNEAFCRITGYQADEFTALSFSDITHPDDLAADVQLARQLAAGEIDQYAMDKRYIHKDGGVVWVRLTVRLVRKGNGAPMYYLPMIENITVRRQAVEALRASEARFSTVFHASPLSIAITRQRDNVFIDVNPAWQSLTGFNRDAVVDHNPLEFNIIVDPARWNHLTQELLQRDSVDGFEMQLRQKSGNIKDLLFSAVSIEVSGEVCILSMAIDITERKYAEYQNRQRNLELTLLYRTSQAFSRLQPLPEIVELLYSAIGQALDNRNLYIALYDEHNQSISFPIYTLNGEYRPPLNRLFGNGITEYILRTKVPLLIQHELATFLAEHGIDLVGTPAKSFLGVPIQAGDRVLGVIAIQDYERENAYLANQMELLETIAVQAAVALENSRLFNEAERELHEREQAEKELRESRDRLAHLSHRLVQAQEQERRSIALELHDEVGQTLTALSLILDEIAHKARESAIQEKIAGLQDLVRNLINQVSTISLELHPRDLDALGLIPGLISLSQRISIQTGIEVDFKHIGLEQMRFTPEIKISAYRIVQEAFTNVIRHSGVKKVSVRIQNVNDTLWIQVQSR
jgi:PAS domain S-box-containing protein